MRKEAVGGNFSRLVYIASARTASTFAIDLPTSDLATEMVKCLFLDNIFADEVGAKDCMRKRRGALEVGGMDFDAHCCDLRNCGIELLSIPFEL